MKYRVAIPADGRIKIRGEIPITDLTGVLNEIMEGGATFVKYIGIDRPLFKNRNILCDIECDEKTLLLFLLKGWEVYGESGD